MTDIDLTNPAHRLAARRYVAGAKRNIRADWDTLVALADALDGPTRAVALDDLTDMAADMAADLRGVAA